MNLLKWVDWKEIRSLCELVFKKFFPQVHQLYSKQNTIDVKKLKVVLKLSMCAHVCVCTHIWFSIQECITFLPKL